MRKWIIDLHPRTRIYVANTALFATVIAAFIAAICWVGVFVLPANAVAALLPTLLWAVTLTFVAIVSCSIFRSFDPDYGDKRDFSPRRYILITS